MIERKAWVAKPWLHDQIYNTHKNYDVTLISKDLEFCGHYQKCNHVD